MQQWYLGVKIWRSGLATSLVLVVNSKTAADIRLGLIPRHAHIVGLEALDQLQAQRRKAIHPASWCAISRREVGHGIVPTVEHTFAINNH